MILVKVHYLAVNVGNSNKSKNFLPSKWMKIGLTTLHYSIGFPLAIKRGKIVPISSLGGIEASLFFTFFIVNFCFIDFYSRPRPNVR